MDNPDRLEPYDVHEDDVGLRSSEIKVFQPWGDARGVPLMAFYTYHTFRPLVAYFSKRTQAADKAGHITSDTSDLFATFFVCQPVDEKTTIRIRSRCAIGRTWCSIRTARSSRRSGRSAFRPSYATNCITAPI